MTDPLKKADVGSQPKEKKTVEVTIDGETYNLSIGAASKLESELQKSYNVVRGQPDDMLTLAKCNTSYNIGKNPYHIQGEYGCNSGETASSNITHLNLSKLAWKPVIKERKRGFSHEQIWVDGSYKSRESRNERMDIDAYISIFICSHCQSTLQHWHTQRKIFLPKIAANTDLCAIKHDSFTHHEEECGSCSACGTPKSAIAELDIETPPMAVIDEPVTLCPTCRDLLIESDESLPFNELPYENHPLATQEQIPKQPYTDPNVKLSGTNEESPYPDDLLEANVGDIGEMEREEFIDFIRSLGGNSISKWTGRNLYNHEIRSIAELYQASEASIAKTPMVSDEEAKEIKEDVEKELQNRYEEHKQLPQKEPIDAN